MPSGLVLAASSPHSFGLLGISSLTKSIDQGATRGELASPRVERRHGPDRRHTSLRSFLKGGITPRRRGGRRADEQHLPIDWHEPYLLFLSVMILLLSVADAFLTLTLIMGGAQEANPLLAFILRDHPELFAVIKMALDGRRRARARRRGAVAVVPHHARRRHPPRHFCGVRRTDRLRMVAAAYVLVT